MNQRSARSYLYTLRVWPEDLGNGHWEWRGVVKYVASGEEHYFRDWGALQELMVGMVDEMAEPINSREIPASTT